VKRFLLVLAILFLPATPSLACSCNTITVQQAVKAANLVFQARLVRVDYLSPITTVPNPWFKDRQEKVPRFFLATLEVSGVWKGQVGKTIVMHEREIADDCVGFWTDIGSEFVVFASQGVLTAAPTKDGVRRIPEWTDKVPVGTKIVSNIACSLSSHAAYAMKSGTLKKLGKSKPPASR